MGAYDYEKRQGAAAVEKEEKERKGKRKNEEEESFLFTSFFFEAAWALLLLLQNETTRKKKKGKKSGWEDGPLASGSVVCYTFCGRARRARCRQIRLRVVDKTKGAYLTAPFKTAYLVVERFSFFLFFIGICDTKILLRVLGV